MKYKTAVKKLMGRGYSRNAASALLSFWRRKDRYHNNSHDIKIMELVFDNRLISRKDAYCYYRLEEK